MTKQAETSRKKKRLKQIIKGGHDSRPYPYCLRACSIYLSCCIFQICYFTKGQKPVRLQRETWGVPHLQKCLVLQL